MIIKSKNKQQTKLKFQELHSHMEATICTFLNDIN